MMDMIEAERIYRICQRCARTVWDRRAPSEDYATRVAHLLLGTCAVESAFKHRRQIGVNPNGWLGGFGFWQLESASVTDSLLLLRGRPGLMAAALSFVGPTLNDALSRGTVREALRLMTVPCGDLMSCLMARLHYMRFPEPVPSTIAEHARYWQLYYNTPMGKGTTARYLRTWGELCEPVLVRA